MQHLTLAAEIMNYDVFGDGFSKVVGPNSPLDDACAPATQQTGSATSAVKLWTAAGFSAKQLVLGVPSYGHGYSISASAAVQNNSLASFPSFNTNSFVLGDSWDAAGPDACGVSQPPSGDFNFWGLISAGYLSENGTIASGMIGNYDACSQTVCFSFRMFYPVSSLHFLALCLQPQYAGRRSLR